MPIIDGVFTDWSELDRLDRPATGTAGYGLYGTSDPNYFYFSITSANGPIGANTTIWLDTDLNRASGYQIWGFTGGAEYNINFTADGQAKLYTGGAGQTFVADLDYRLNADRSAMELALPKALLAGAPDIVRVFADVNDAAFLPNDYANINFTVGSLPPLVYGAVTLDGDISDWGASTRLDTAATGTAGYGLYGQVQGDAYVFAITSANGPIGANTTIWLDTDLNRATGYQIWGFTGGAEYNVNFTADGAAKLYTGGAGQTFVADLDYRLNADRSVVELAVAKSLLAGAPDMVRVFADVNDAAYLPNSYANMNITVGSLAPLVYGAVTLDGDISDWGASTRLDTPATGAAGYGLYGQVQNNAYVFALTSANGPIGANTTIWLDTDLNRATGYQIWGTTGGVEYNVNFTADGQAKLYTGGAGQTFVADLDYRLNADRSVVELAVSKSLLAGAPNAVRVFADVNDAAFLPNDYASTDIFVTTPAPAVGGAMRIAIVYSETSANNFYNKTAYGQLFMSAQNQAIQAGVPFDLLTEADLKDVANLAGYKAIVFPGFANVKAADLFAIESALTAAALTYKVGLIAAGNFMTNDETGAALAGDSYARMVSLLGVRAESFGATTGVDLVAGAGTNPILAGYAAGDLVGSYTNTAYNAFVDTTGSGQTLFNQVVTDANNVSQNVSGVIATTTNGRNVHFASDALIGNSNILGSAIDWVVNGDTPDVSLAMTRGSSLFYSRSDMDQSQETYDVQDHNPGIYDVLLPILADWSAKYNFVGSYYANIGMNAPDQVTDWSISGPYYQQLIAMGNEIGTHSWTHPDDSNLLSDSNPQLAALLAMVDPRNPNAVDPATLSAANRAILEQSFVFQFQYAALKIAQELGINVTGGAVPGAPETLETALQILPYFNYITGGFSGIGAGYPGAFGYLTPDNTSAVYLAPNISSDFTLVGFKNLTPAQAAAVWAQEYASVVKYATTPIIAFPWHDYGPTNWDLGDPVRINYSLAMFESLIAIAAQDGAEFVTGTDLAARIASFAGSSIDIVKGVNTVTATVTSSDAGKFALTLGDGATIASVNNWYAYDSTKVLLPQNGGQFVVNLGTTPADVTHLTSLPMRADLLTVSGNGANLGVTFSGKGEAGLTLKSQGADAVLITGADRGSVNGTAVKVGFDTAGTQSLNVQYQAGGGVVTGTALADILLGGSGADRLIGAGGNDLMVGGGGADAFVFNSNIGNSTVDDFISGMDRLEFYGLGFADAAQALGQFQVTAAGMLLSFGTEGSVLLAGLGQSNLTVDDIMVGDTVLV